MVCHRQQARQCIKTNEGDYNERNCKSGYWERQGSHRLPGTWAIFKAELLPATLKHWFPSIESLWSTCLFLLTFILSSLAHSFSFPMFKINSVIQIIVTKLCTKQKNWQCKDLGIIFHLFQQFMFSVRIVWGKGMHNTALIVGNVSITKRWNCIYPSCYLLRGFLCL